jgi:hypothetical protein
MYRSSTLTIVEQLVNNLLSGVVCSRSSATQIRKLKKKMFKLGKKRKVLGKIKVFCKVGIYSKWVKFWQV